MNVFFGDMRQIRLPSSVCVCGVISTILQDDIVQGDIIQWILFRGYYPVDTLQGVFTIIQGILFREYCSGVIVQKDILGAFQNLAMFPAIS